MLPRTVRALLVLLVTFVSSSGSSVSAADDVSKAAPACHEASPPSDCRGVFKYCPIKLKQDDLGQIFSARDSWIKNQPENWFFSWSKHEQTKEDRPEQTVDGKYPCSYERNGPTCIPLENQPARAAMSAGGTDGPTERNKCFTKVDLRDANISTAAKGGTSVRADLRGACLRNADLRGADLRDADLRGANLYKADLSNANLDGADLTGAILDCANFRGADIFNAKLIDANLYRTELQGASLRFSDLSNARFEPNSLPTPGNLYGVMNLHSTRYEMTPNALVQLRKTLEVAGMREAEREITYALNRGSRIRSHPIESAASYVLFEITSGWGMAPWRSLWLLIGFIPVFVVMYIGMIRSGKGGQIERVWPSGQSEDVSHSIAWIVYFSILSAFHVGWRDLNVGTWISRMQSRDYTLRSTGWVRAVSGFQSLLSVALLALWALTYFGRPFS